MSWDPKILWYVRCCVFGCMVNNAVGPSQKRKCWKCTLAITKRTLKVVKGVSLSHGRENIIMSNIEKSAFTWGAKGESPFSLPCLTKVDLNWHYQDHFIRQLLYGFVLGFCQTSKMLKQNICQHRQGGFWCKIWPYQT